jgi:hypothetical protein
LAAAGTNTSFLDMCEICLNVLYESTGSFVVSCFVVIVCRSN